MTPFILLLDQMIIFYATARVVPDLANDTYLNSVEVNESIHTFNL